MPPSGLATGRFAVRESIMRAKIVLWLLTGQIWRVPASYWTPCPKEAMSKPAILNFGQAPQVKKGAAVARPAPAKKAVAKAAAAVKPSLPDLDYEGPVLTSKAAETLRARFAPKDDTKTVWF